MRFPCVRQNDHNDCGAAAIATVARFYKVPLSVGRVRELCATDAEGTSLFGLMKGAERLGFTAKAAKAPLAVLKKCPTPFIAHVLKQYEGLASSAPVGHYVTVFKIGDKTVEVADPAEGPRKLTIAEFEKMWTGAILVLLPTPTLASVKPSAPSYVRFLGLLAGRWPLFFECILASVLFAGLGLLTSFYVQTLIDSVISGGRLRTLNFLSAGVCVVIVFRVAFHSIVRYLLVHLSQKIDVAISMEYYQHVLKLPLSFFEARSTGEILARMSDADKIRQAISGTILTSFVDFFFVLAAGAVMFLYNGKLALVTLATVPFLLVVVFVQRGAIRKAQLEAMVQNAALSAHVIEVVAGNAAIKAARAEDHMRSTIERKYMTRVRTVFRLAMLAVSTDALSMLVTGIGSTVVFWVGASLVMENQLTVGQLLFFQSLLAHILEPLSRLANANLDLQDSMIAADRVGEILDLSPEGTGQRERLRPKSLRGQLVFEGVKFRYGFRDWVLRGIDLAVEPGQTIALVGRSGSGKTTIGRLIASFYAPTEGRILIDGHDLRDVELEHYRRMVGIVDQDCTVFSTTIRDNIRLGAPTTPFERVVEAAKAAGAHEFIDKLPERYDTVVGERGANLSGGQRQRLAIARALIGNPRVLLLDEATSHLDSETERLVQRTLAEVARTRTTIIIAHRLSTIMAADRIYVIEAGRVAEEGSHAELLAAHGTYASMWREQIPEGLPGASLPALDEAALDGLDRDALVSVLAEEIKREIDRRAWLPEASV
jgi:ATP-binding cassette subfamily B protein